MAQPVRGHRANNEAPASDCHQGPRQLTHHEAGYIYAVLS